MSVNLIACARFVLIQPSAQVLAHHGSFPTVWCVPKTSAAFPPSSWKRKNVLMNFNPSHNERYCLGIKRTWSEFIGDSSSWDHADVTNHAGHCYDSKTALQQFDAHLLTTASEHISVREQRGVALMSHAGRGAAAFSSFASGCFFTRSNKLPAVLRWEKKPIIEEAAGALSRRRISENTSWGSYCQGYYWAHGARTDVYTCGRRSSLYAKYEVKLTSQIQ